MPIDFKEKLGPLPVWAWGVIGGGIVIVGTYVLNRGSSSTGSAGGSSTLDASGYQTSGIKMTSDSKPDVQTFDNNTLWLTRASRAAATSLSKSYTDVYTALQKWLSGQTISEDEKSLVDVAVGVSGAPPEGTTGTTSVQKSSRTRAAELLDSVFGGNFTDYISRLGGDQNSSREASISTWANRLDSGLSEQAARAQMISGPSYQNWLSKGRPTNG